jgi:diaminohydroxyphosphoribosylaminopyrimidine deaminase / 5-amino-6-(5-phosphoribosylamino)uracil reductase
MDQRVERSVDDAWDVCLAVVELRRAGRFPESAARFLLDDSRRLARTEPQDPRALIGWRPGAGWSPVGGWVEPALELFELYRPLCNAHPGRPTVVAHLGQSIDGRIATASGDACFVNGQQNLVHLHRMRALCDAVLVGAGTVAADNPQLTTRLVAGEHPTRVVLDPSARIGSDRRLYRDGHAPTLIVCDPSRLAAVGGEFGHVSSLGVAVDDGGFDLGQLIDSLYARGLQVLFVEGGGVTVSRFLEQNRLDRLQIAVAPVIIGSGREGIRLPEVAAMRDCLRPRHRMFKMGDDMLWDFDLRPETGLAD